MSATLQDVTAYLETAGVDELTQVARKARHKLIQRSPRKELIAKATEAAFDIIDSHYGRNKLELCGPTRHASLAEARHALFALLRECGLTTIEVGVCTDKDHSTVVNGVHSWSDRLDTEPKTRAKWASMLRDMKWAMDTKDTTQ